MVVYLYRSGQILLGLGNEHKCSFTESVFSLLQWTMSHWSGHCSCPAHILIRNFGPFLYPLKVTSSSLLWRISLAQAGTALQGDCNTPALISCLKLVPRLWCGVSQSPLWGLTKARLHLRPPLCSSTLPGLPYFPEGTALIKHMQLKPQAMLLTSRTLNIGQLRIKQGILWQNLEEQESSDYLVSSETHRKRTVKFTIKKWNHVCLQIFIN